MTAQQRHALFKAALNKKDIRSIVAVSQSALNTALIQQQCKVSAAISPARSLLVQSFLQMDYRPEQKYFDILQLLAGLYGSLFQKNACSGTC
ncbi:hypothetical protein [Oceanospirillum sediminis]|uniref:Uncharacterized protein n=1 Tax=Oceanospirillum sediminis TaxID=2760088 RepID=A0A839ITC8_9GAMM|nr:hypothetical protein [Oceanospirillum sediminis]MBB1487396.1 hypothetical protein [Oceanospirillum sediminis]